MKKAKQGFLIIVLALVAVAVVVVGICTNWFKANFTTFTVAFNGNSNYDEQIITLNEGDNVFNVNYVFGWATNESGYNVIITPNVTNETDFKYSIDGQSYYFSTEKNLTKGFDIIKSKNSFKIVIPKNFDVNGALKNIYPNAVIAVEEYNRNLELFNLTITNKDASRAVSYLFTFYIPVEGVTLSPGEVII